MLISPVFAFAQNKNSITIKELETMIDSRVDSGIDNKINDKLKEKELNIISSYEKFTNSFNWVLAGIGFFLATLVIFTFGYGKYWASQIKNDAKEVKQMRNKTEEYLQEVQKIANQTKAKFKKEEAKVQEASKHHINKMQEYTDGLQNSTTEVIDKNDVYVPKNNNDFNELRKLVEQTKY